MKTVNQAKPAVMLLLLVAGMGFLTSAKKMSAPTPDRNAFLHALSNLRAARWMLEHRPGNWQQTNDEVEAVRRIDAAIAEIKKEAIDDGKDLNYHPEAKELPDHMGRLRKAVEYLKAARNDIGGEDEHFAHGLRGRAIGHIDGAIHAAEKAIHQ